MSTRIEVNSAASDYTPPKATEMETVTHEKICEFFTNYISSDSLGRIANAHVRKNMFSFK